MAENLNKKYTVIRAGRHGKPGDLLEMHPRQATFMLTEQLITEGELKGKALQTKLDEIAKADAEAKAQQQEAAESEQTAETEGTES